MTTSRLAPITLTLLAFWSVSVSAQSFRELNSANQQSRTTQSRTTTPRRYQVKVKIQAADGVNKFTMLNWTQAVRAAGADGVSEVPGIALPKSDPQDPGGSGVRKTGKFEIEVFAVIGPAGRLYIAKDVFSLNAKAQLNLFITKLKNEGVPKPDPTAPRWGLSVSQLSVLTGSLTQPLKGNLENKPLRDFIRELSASTKLDIQLSPRLRGAVSRINLSSLSHGLSSGSGSAYVLRNFGLAMEPRVMDDGRVGILVMLESESNRPWPVGLKPESFPGKIAPSLLRFVEYETTEMPLIDVLAAWGDVVQLEMVLDVSRLADMNIDLQKLKSTMVIKKSPIGTAMRRTLGPLGLKYELRVDESNGPFIWITATRPTGPKPK